jgi:hypothetical protein
MWHRFRKGSVCISHHVNNNYRLRSRSAIGLPVTLTVMLPMLPPPKPPFKKRRTMDRIDLLALELTNRGHAVPTAVLGCALQEKRLILTSYMDVAVVSPRSAPDARLEELPPLPAPSAPPGRTSDSDSEWTEEEDLESSSEEEDPEVQLLLHAQWLQCGTCVVTHGKDAVGRHLWAYHLSCVEPGCRVAAMTHVSYGSTPVHEAVEAGWRKHGTYGWRGASCHAHG